MDNDTELTKEQRIMQVMRKVLTNIARETVPPPGLPHPLSTQTIEDIKQCLNLISARERELNDEQGVVNTDRPYFVDEPQATKVVPINQIKRSAKPNPS